MLVFDVGRMQFARLFDYTCPHLEDATNPMSSLEQKVRNIVGTTLQLGGTRTASLTRDTALFGSLPELDSMAVVTLLTSLEESFGIEIGDDEISADIFASFGTLVDFVESKLAVA